jgi:tetratricopeptide (TPR) repeat protein
VRSDALALHVDIVPTVLDALGLPEQKTLPGRSLLRGVNRDGEDADSVGYFESRGPHYNLGWAVIEGVRTARWKYTAAPAPPELYDIRADPREQNDRVETEPAVRASMETLLAQLRSESGPPEEEDSRLELRPEEMQRLAALGYLEVGQGLAQAEEPDPRRLATVFSWVDQARSAASSGRYERAIDLLETLAESVTVRPLVLRSLAPVYAESGRYEDAIAAYRDYIELTGANEARLSVAQVLLTAGRPGDAIEEIEQMSDSSPQVGILRAYALSRLGRHGDAREAVDLAFARRPRDPERLRQRAALVIDAAPLPDGEAELRALLAEAPGDATLQSQLGYYLAVWGQPEQAEEARELLQAAAEAAPEDVDVLANLGWGSYKLGLYTEAVAALEATLALDERRPLERVRLALALREVGELRRARALARSALALRPGAEWADEVRDVLLQFQDESVGSDRNRAGKETE